MGHQSASLRRQQERVTGAARVRRLLAQVLTSIHYAVRGDSMGPGFKSGQMLLVSRRALSGSGPSRGDVVIVRDPRDSRKALLKRVVGLPGEDVRLRDGMLFVDGEQHAEPYLGGGPETLGLEEKSWRLGDDEYFVMGDNRSRSTDSREFGPVGRMSIRGRAWFRYWPPGAWGQVG